MNILNEGNVCKFGDLRLGELCMLRALRETRFAIKIEVPQARPYPAALILRHPECKDAPGVVVLGNDATVIRMPDLVIELPTEETQVSFDGNDEIPGTILQSAQALLLVSYFGPSQLFYADIRTGGCQFHVDSNFVIFKSWRLTRLGSKNAISLFSVASEK